MSKAIVLGLLALIISGCSVFTKEVPVTKVEYIEKPIKHPPTPESLALLHVEFDVISKKDFLEILNKHLDQKLSDEEAENLSNDLTKYVFKDDEALWTLNEQNYSNLGLNMQEIKRYILQQKEIIIYYRTDTASDQKSEKEN